MSDQSSLRVAPAVMDGIAQSLGGGAEALMARLVQLDGEVGEMLGGWQGDSGSAYSAAWQLWHRGAKDVQLGLAELARLVAAAGAAQQRTESGSARAMREVR